MTAPRSVEEWAQDVIKRLQLMGYIRKSEGWLPAEDAICRALSEFAAQETAGLHLHESGKGYGCHAEIAALQADVERLTFQLTSQEAAHGLMLHNFQSAKSTALAHPRIVEAFRERAAQMIDRECQQAWIAEKVRALEP